MLVIQFDIGDEVYVNDVENCDPYDPPTLGEITEITITKTGVVYKVMVESSYGDGWETVEYQRHQVFATREEYADALIQKIQEGIDCLEDCNAKVLAWR